MSSSLTCLPRRRRPSLPANLVGSVLVLKELYDLSDSQTADALKYDMRPLCFCVMLDSWTAHRKTGRKPSSGRAYTPALSETYDAAESVPTQVERGTDHATRRGWTVAATFKDDGFSGFKEITRDGFGELIETIEAGAVDVVIVRDIDRLTRNLTDWNAFEKACVRHGVRLSAYTGGDLDLSTAEGACYGGRETLRARRESAVKSARVREAQDREARKGRRVGGGQRWFGYTRIYANPDEPNHKKRHILREEINPVEADAIRDAATRVLDHGESVGSIARDWTARGIKPVAAKQWWPTSIVGTLTSPRLAGLREWQGRRYPTRSGRPSSMWTPMSGWSSCSRTRRGVSRGCITGGTDKSAARIPTGA